MKRAVMIAVVTMLALIAGCAQQEGARTPKTELKDFAEKASYAMGKRFGQNLQPVKDDIDMASLMQGIEDAMEGREGLLSSDEEREVMQEFQGKMREASERERGTMAEKNLAEGQAFLAENKTKEGVITEESGLQYTVLQEGEGPKPAATDQVTVHYRGTLIDGTEFDSSYGRGEPTTFPLNRVIPGWTEGVQLMSVGSKYKFFIPSDLAYGERGARGAIGPNAALIFEIELVSIGGQD